MDIPTNTVRRALEELAANKLAVRHEEKQGNADLWSVHPNWAHWKEAWAATKRREAGSGHETCHQTNESEDVGEDKKQESAL